jgi:hypothetical protein
MFTLPATRLATRWRLAFFAFIAAAMLVIPCFAIAETQEEEDSGRPSVGLIDVGKQSEESGVARISGLSTLTGRMISSVLGIVGVIFFVLMIYAGFLWMTAAGSDEKVTKAKNIFSTSIIGLLVIVGAYYILDFVLDAIYGSLES